MRGIVMSAREKKRPAHAIFPMPHCSVCKDSIMHPSFSPALLLQHQLAASESFSDFFFVLYFISFTVFLSSPTLISCIQIHTSQLQCLPSEVQREFFFIRSGFISHPFSSHLPRFRWIRKLVSLDEDQFPNLPQAAPSPELVRYY